MPPKQTPERHSELPRQAAPAGESTLPDVEPPELEEEEEDAAVPLPAPLVAPVELPLDALAFPVEEPATAVAAPELVLELVRPPLEEATAVEAVLALTFPAAVDEALEPLETVEPDDVDAPADVALEEALEVAAALAAAVVLIDTPVPDASTQTPCAEHV